MILNRSPLKLIDWGLRLSRWLSRALILLFFVIVLGQWLLIYADRYLADVFNRSFAEQGLTLKYDTFNTSWQPFGVKITFDGLSVKQSESASETREWFNASGNIAFDVWQSVLFLQPTFREFELETTPIQTTWILNYLQQDKASDKPVDWYQAVRAGETTLDSILQTLALTDAVKVNAQIELPSVKAPTVFAEADQTPDVLQITLNQAASKMLRQTEIQGNFLADETAEQIFACKMEKPAHQLSWSIRCDANTKNLTLPALDLPENVANLRILQAALESEWIPGDFHDGKLTWQLQRDKTPIQLEALWHRILHERWSFVFSKPAINASSADDIEEYPLIINVDESVFSDTLAIKVFVERFNWQEQSEWARFLSHYLNDARRAELMRMAEIGGELRDLQVVADYQQEAFRNLSIFGRFEAVTIPQSAKLPFWLTASVDGEFRYVDDHIKLHLETEDAALHYPNLFEYPVALDAFETVVDVTLGEVWEVMIDHMAIVNPSISISLSGRFWPNPEEGLMADILGDVHRGDIQEIRPLLPDGIMKPALVDYLVGAVKQSTIREATFAVSGPLRRFPFTGHDGTFLIQAELEDTDYQFASGWPVLEDMAATLRFRSDALSITVKNARWIDQAIESVTADIVDMTGTSMLNVSAEQSVTLSHVIDVLKNSPIQTEETGGFHALKATGDAPVNFSLAMSLSENSDVFDWNATLDFNGNTFSPDPNMPPLESLVGRLLLADEAIQTPKPLSGQFLNQPASIDYQSVRTEDAFVSKTVLKGMLDIAGLRQFYPQHIALNWLSGSSPVQIQFEEKRPFDQSKKTPKPVFTLDSTMRGIAFDLPSPFEKTKNSILPLKLRMVGDRDVQLNATLGPNARLLGHLYQADQKGGKTLSWRSGHLLLGAQQKPLVKAPDRFMIEGQLDTVDLPTWLAWSDKATAKFRRLKTTKQTSPDWLSALGVSVNVQTVSGATLPLEFVHISREPILDAPIAFDSEHAKGVLILKSDLPDIDSSVRFSKLIWPSVRPSAEPVGDTRALETSVAEAIKSWPRLKVDCDECYFDDFKLGALSGVIKPDGDTMRANIQQTISTGGTVDWMLTWSQHGKENLSRLTGDLRDIELEPLLESWGFESTIKDSELTGVMSINWPGPPGNFGLENAWGHGEFNLSEGNLTEVSDRSGRLFSLFSLQTLKRRLLLDFSDIYKDGFFFNDIELDLSLHNGKVVNRKAHIDGLAASVDLTGSTNIIDKTIDQEAVVRPAFGSTLPFAAVIAWANPAVGLATFVVQRLFTSQLEVITEIRYRIVGDLENPTIEDLGKKAGTVELKSLEDKPEKRPQAASDEDVYNVSQPEDEFEINDE